jgi:DNA polymerase/3'-5' exonuclease PolX
MGNAPQECRFSHMFQFTQTVQLIAEQESTPTSVLLARITNPRIAEVLFNIATLLEMQQANPYRVAAYRNAARGLMALRESAADIIRRGERLELPGLGERLRRKITELVTTGRMTFYDDLCEESLPEDVRNLLAVPHVGPRTALRFTNYLGIHSVADLYAAAHTHKIREHYGFGPRSEQRLEEGARAVLQAQPAASAQPTQTEPPAPQAA